MKNKLKFRSLFLISIFALAFCSFGCKHDKNESEEQHSNMVPEEKLVAIKKIRVGAITKEGEDIKKEMSFTAFATAPYVDVLVQTEPADAVLEFNPPLTEANKNGGKLSLPTDETTVTCTVKKGNQKNEYTIKVRKNILVDTFGIWAGKKKGVPSGSTNKQIEKVLSLEKDVIIEFSGPTAMLTVGSKITKWETFKVNGKDETSIVQAGNGFQSIAFLPINISEKDKIVDMHVLVGANSNKIEFFFKLKRVTETVDVPVDTLFIKGRNVIDRTTVLIPLQDASKPEYEGFEPTPVKVQWEENIVSKVTIDGKECEIKKDGQSQNQNIYFASCDVTGVSPNGKEVSVVIEPVDKENYHAITWVFKLAYKAPPNLGVDYEINGKVERDLDKAFIEAVKKNENPLITLDSNHLHLKLKFTQEVENLKINESTIQGSTLTKEENRYVVRYSMPLTNNETQVNIEINPKDTSLYSSKTFRFKAKGNANKEKIEPILMEISGDENFTADFLNHLSDNTKPLYETNKDSADILIALPLYAHEFLCKEIKVNDDKAEISNEGQEVAIVASIPVNAVAKDVKIEFIGKDGISDNVVWTFQVKKGDKKPSIPEDEIYIFKINGESSSLPDELVEHLTDGTNPTHKIDGNKATVEIGTGTANLIKKVVFNIDGEDKEEVTPVKKGEGILAKYVAEYTFNLTGIATHPVKITIIPESQNYSDLVYSFSLQSSGKNPPLPIFCGVNGNFKNTGYKDTLREENATLFVQARENIMLEVKIGEKGQDEKVCEIKKSQSNGKDVWQAFRYVSLPIDGSEKTFVIIAKPINENEYRESRCEFTLKGTKVSDKNAEFVFTSGKKPIAKVDSEVEWVDPALQTSEYINDYGAKAVTLKAYTVNPRATVKFQLVDIKNNPIVGQPIHSMTNNGGVHVSQKINLFTDKPTRIKAWVIAEDGSTTNDKKGVWKSTYNPVLLAWGYFDMPKGEDYKVRAYDLIEIEKNSVGTDNKVYLIFVPWKEEDGSIVLNDNLPTYQSSFEKLGAYGEEREFYKTAIDVSSLINNTAPNGELEAILKIKRKNVICFTYKVKIKIKK